LLLAHEEAFGFFGGVTEEILYDNPKTMVIKRERGTNLIDGLYSFVKQRGTGSGANRVFERLEPR
jgi:transposase